LAWTVVPEIKADILLFFAGRAFKSFLETAPEIRRMVETFYNSKFGEFLKCFSDQRVRNPWIHSID
jgi:hypothetical protein